MRDAEDRAGAAVIPGTRVATLGSRTATLPRDWGEGSPIGTPDGASVVSPRRRLPAARNALLVAAASSASTVAAAQWASTETTAATVDDPAGRNAPLDGLEIAPGTLHHLQSARTVVLVLAGLTLLAIGVAAVFVLRWQHVAVRNMRPLGIHPRLSATAAAWSWFVPIWWVVGPKRAYDDLWRAAEPDGAAAIPREHWTRREVPLLFSAWWGFWLVGVVVALGTAGSPDRTLGDQQAWLVLMTVGGILLIVAGLLLLRVMSLISDRHDERRAALQDADPPGR